MRSLRSNGLAMVVAVAVAGGFAGTASALTNSKVIYDNGGPDQDNAFASDFDFPEQAADEFVLLPGRSTVTDVHWWGAYGFADNLPDGDDDFTIRIFGDAGGAPTDNPIHEFAVGAVDRVDSGLDIASADIFEYWTFVPATQLTAGDTYWLSIVNNTPSDSDDWFWANSSERTGDNSWFRVNDGDAWIASTAFDKDLAFKLTGPIPEPVTAALGVLGLAGLSVATRRRRLA